MYVLIFIEILLFDILNFHTNASISHFYIEKDLSLDTLRNKHIYMRTHIYNNTNNCGVAIKREKKAEIKQIRLQLKLAQVWNIF